MIGKMFFPGECLGTIGALMWIVSSMQMYVVIEMFLPGECLRAVGALKRCLAGMLSATCTFRSYIIMLYYNIIIISIGV